MKIREKVPMKFAVRVMCERVTFILLTALFFGIFGLLSKTDFSVLAQTGAANDLVRQGMAEPDVEKKQVFFEKAIEAEDRNFFAVNNLATCFEMRQDFDRAILLYKKAISLAQNQNEKFPDADFGLGDVFFAKKEFKSAWEAYNLGLTHKPDDSETLAKIETLKKDFPHYFSSKGEFLLVDADRIVRSLTPTRGMKVKPRIDLVIEFDYNSDTIRPEAKRQIENIAMALKNRNLANSSFTLAGHTDSRGSDSYNKALSEKRAMALLKKLVQDYSIEENRLRAIGYGEARLKVSNEKTEDDFQQNRRVELIFGREE